MSRFCLVTLCFVSLSANAGPLPLPSRVSCYSNSSLQGEPIAEFGKETMMWFRLRLDKFPEHNGSFSSLLSNSNGKPHWILVTGHNFEDHCTTIMGSTVCFRCSKTAGPTPGSIAEGLCRAHGYLADTFKLVALNAKDEEIGYVGSTFWGKFSIGDSTAGFPERNLVFEISQEYGGETVKDRFALPLSHCK